MKPAIICLGIPKFYDKSLGEMEVIRPVNKTTVSAALQRYYGKPVIIVHPSHHSKEEFITLASEESKELFLQSDMVVSGGISIKDAINKTIKADIETKLKNTIWEQYNNGTLCCKKVFRDNYKMADGKTWEVKPSGTIEFDGHIVKVVGDTLVGKHKTGIDLLYKNCRKYSVPVRQPINPNDRWINLKSVKKVMIGTQKFPSPETDGYHSVYPGIGTTHGQGVQRGHQNAVKWALQQDGPVLLFENDAYPLTWYTDWIPKPSKDADIVWLGFTRNQDFTRIDKNYSSPYHYMWGAHAVLLVTKKGKEQYLKAANTEYAVDEQIFRAGDAHQLVLNLPCFCQLPLSGANYMNAETILDVDGNVGEPIQKSDSKTVEIIKEKLVGEWAQYNDGYYCCNKEFLKTGRMKSGMEYTIHDDGKIEFDGHNVSFIDNTLTGYYKDGTKIEYKKQKTPTHTLKKAKKIIVYVQVYKSSTQERQIELDTCLRINKKNKSIEIIEIHEQERISFDYFFNKINQRQDDDTISVIQNSDIIFDESIELQKFMVNSDVYALSRYEGVSISQDDKLNTTNIHQRGVYIGKSQDQWIFRGKIKPVYNQEFGLGIWGCDGAIQNRLSQVGYDVFNPCNAIKIYHWHYTNVRTNQHPAAPLPHYDTPACTLNIPISGQDDPELIQQFKSKLIGKWDQYNNGVFSCRKEFLKTGVMDYGQEYTIASDLTIEFDGHTINMVGDELIGEYRDGTKLKFKKQSDDLYNNPRYTPLVATHINLYVICNKHISNQDQTVIKSYYAGVSDKIDAFFVVSGKTLDDYVEYINQRRDTTENTVSVLVPIEYLMDNTLLLTLNMSDEDVYKLSDDSTIKQFIFRNKLRYTPTQTPDDSFNQTGYEVFNPINSIKIENSNSHSQTIPMVIDICKKNKTFISWKSQHPSIVFCGIFDMHCKNVFRMNEYVKQDSSSNWFSVSNADLVDWFQNHRPKHPYYLVTTNSDVGIYPQLVEYADDPNLITWYAQNQDCIHSKIKAVPIGLISPYEYGSDCRTHEHIYKNMNNKKTNLFFQGFSLGRAGGQRELCLECTKIKPYPNTAHPQYMADLQNSYFCLSPNGNGIDCYRVWEQLGVKTIPIITRNKMKESGLYQGLPVIMIDRWEDFKQEDYTPELYHQMMSDFNPYCMTADRWIPELKSLK